MSMSAKELHEELMDEPHDERDTEKVQLILRALSLLAAVEDGDEIARELQECVVHGDVTGEILFIRYEILDKAAARITLDAQEKAALNAELASVKAELAAETAIVDRIWDQLGRPSYEELKGRSIYDLIDALKAELASVKAHAEAMADAIQFSDMAILTVAKAAAEAYRAAHPKE